MNIYEKLQNIKIELQKTEIKKTGKNLFAKYEYFELADFLPTINELMLKYKLIANINYGLDMAILTIVDIEDPDLHVLFKSPMSTAELRGCHAVQNLGAVQTYLKRYLYIAAFDILELDILDLTHDKGKSETLSDAQIKRAFAIAKSVKLGEIDINKWIKTKYNKDSIKELTSEEYKILCESLEAKKGDVKNDIYIK